MAKMIIGNLMPPFAKRDVPGIIKGGDDVTLAEDGTIGIDTNYDNITGDDTRAIINSIQKGNKLKNILGKIVYALNGLITLGEMRKMLVNNGTTTEAGKFPLDAAFGKNLQDQITVLNAEAKFIAKVQGWSYEELSSNMTKDADWTKYLLLIFSTGTYGNWSETLVAPVEYFQETADGNRILMKLDGSTIGIYKDGNSRIRVLCQNLVANQTMRIYGVIRK